MHGIQDQAVTRITTLEQMVLKRFWHWITRHVDTVKKQKLIHKGTRWEHELKFFIKYAEKGIRSKGSSNLFIRMIDSYVFGGKKKKKNNSFVQSFWSFILFGSFKHDKKVVKRVHTRINFSLYDYIVRFYAMILLYQL